MTKQFEYTWEQAIEILRKDPQHQKLIYDSYLTADLKDNCRRFLASSEFSEVLRLIGKYSPAATNILDLPAGNGIASFAFAKSGFNVVAVEPDPSASVGRGAIEFVQVEEQIKDIHIVDAYGENLPFSDQEFDVVYIRQGLHHARDLRKMVSEAVRVLRSGGLLIAAREPVVDDYDKGLQTFLDAQPDHQLFGGEHAFLHKDYLGALQSTGADILHDLGPRDSIINLFPNSFENIETMLLNSRPGRILGTVLPSRLVVKIGLSFLKRTDREQGRLFTFVARRN